MKLGSLFDGIGGFPYSAQRHGITPVWASEIEAACVSITKRHFPEMQHLGDITQINGAEIEPVDVVTFGSPCQDLSVAGKRAGLDGARSGLFNHAMRIINEMREKTNGEYPKFAVWENVPGALSSNKGLDFRAVLQAFTKNEIPMPDNDSWATAGVARSDVCDLGWRILDAQHWGVPQRRRRIFLVADFRGERAAEILFKPESLRGHFTQGGETGEAVAGSAGNDVESANCFVCKTNQTGSNGLGVCENTAYTLEAGGVGQAITFSRQSFHEYKTDAVSSTQTVTQNNADSSPALICVSDTQRDAKICVDLAPTLTCMHEQPYIVGHAVRRLTPVECERLQGFPDNWAAFGHDDKPISDSKRYAAIGNSVAIPCVDYVIGGIVDELHKTAY